MLNTKRFFIFDDVTNKLTGFIDAQESPEVPGDYLKPDNCTDVKPLPYKDGFTQWFDGEIWIYKTLPSVKPVKIETPIIDFELKILSVRIYFRITFPF